MNVEQPDLTEVEVSSTVYIAQAEAAKRKKSTEYSDKHNLILLY